MEFTFLNAFRFQILQNNAMLHITRSSIDLLSDATQYQQFRRSIKGGTCSAMKRFTEMPSERSDILKLTN